MARRIARAVRAPGLATIRPTVLREIAHDPGAHTQGLAYAEGQLYESTGLVGASTLRRLDLQSGDVRQMVRVADVWAEGIAASAGSMVQITYTEGLAMRYRLPTLEPEGSFGYPGEGWGLAADDEGFVMSDGSDTLRLLDARFQLRSRLYVRLAGRPLRGLNDLEYVDGHIFACVLWHSDIYEIDAQSGDVVRLIDCSEIVRRSGRASYRDVLNGIAHAPDRRSYFVTGKQWPRLFEIRIAG
jgi:glutaminyl-peptide cyclotransferase